MKRVSVATDPPHQQASPLTTSRPDRLSVGVVVWLASELMFFAGLFAAYYTLRSENAVWPPDDVELDVFRAFVFTVVLLASSATIHHAVALAERGDRRRSLRWLAITIVLGAAFLVNLGFEWAGNDFGLSTHAYGSIYYLLTGAHGAHLAGGLILIAAAAWSISGTRPHHPLGATVTVSSYYWHFVDFVWILVFATVFIVQ